MPSEFFRISTTWVVDFRYDGHPRRWFKVVGPELDVRTSMSAELRHFQRTHHRPPARRCCSSPAVPGWPRCWRRSSNNCASNRSSDMLLWGMRRSAGFYAADDLRTLLTQAPGLRVRLVAEHLEGAPQGGERLSFETGTVVDALERDPAALTGRDFYIAGPPAMLRGLTPALSAQGIDSRRLRIDSFGT